MSMDSTPTDDLKWLEPLARRAADLVQDGNVVGLGSGRAASACVLELGRRVAAGLRIQGVPTSLGTEELARSCGIPLASPDQVLHVDLDIDGADEVDEDGNLVKGYGGALVRERLVASVARRLIIVVGPEKRVSVLGDRGKLPVEVLPFGWQWTARRLRDEFGWTCEPRQAGQQPFVSDNGHYILDCRITPLQDAREIYRRLRQLPGVVDAGLFLDYSPTVLVKGE